MRRTRTTKRKRLKPSRNRHASSRRRHRSVFDKKEHMRRVQKEYKGPRGRLNPKDLLGYSMGEMVEFTHPKTGERAYGKIVDWQRTEDGIIAELSVKATLKEDGSWIKYPDFYDFQYLPVGELLEHAPRGVYKERTTRRARFERRRRAVPLGQGRSSGYGTGKLMEEIYSDPRVQNHFFDVLLELAKDTDLEQSEEMAEYEYAPAAVYLAEEMKNYFEANYDLPNFGAIDWNDLAELFIEKEKRSIDKTLYTTLYDGPGFGKRAKTMKRRKAAAETLTYDPNYSGIGKFNSNIDEQVYGWSLEGWGGEQLGSADGFGYHELIEEPEGVLVKQPEGDWSFQAAIVAEDNNGFVYVTYYDTVADGRAAWAEIEADYEDYLDDVRKMNPDMDEDELY